MKAWQPPLNSSLQGLVYTLIWQKLTMLLHDTNVKSSTVKCTQVYYSIFMFGKFTLLNIFCGLMGPLKGELNIYISL